MLSAYGNDGSKYIACETNKGEMDFYCSQCKSIVILKKGSKKVHHFAHKPPVDCIYSENESDTHYKCKQDIYLALKTREDCINVDCEKDLGKIRADVYWENLKGEKFAIEVQKSSISTDYIKYKMTRYKELGIYVIWLLPSMLSTAKREARDTDNKNNNINLVKPLEWHKYLHKLYFGKLYIWCGNLDIQVIHLDSYIYYIESGNWVDESDISTETNWYQDNYDRGHYGGHPKFSKSKKVAKTYNKTLNLVNDFSSSKQRKNIKFDTIDCLLLNDRIRSFWKQ
ncbi:MAG: competence protein CoiA [Alphaproteobacteria bacterium]|jgi:competence protein CoiA|nr:competence protein CoiA [Alphaproteobacteria bacterium]